MDAAASLVERDRRANARLQKLRFFPSALTGGRGCRVRDERGAWLLDLSASCTAASLGYAHPAWVEAVSRAAADPAGFTVLTNASLPATQLAERLLELTPGEGERRVWIGHSGSDANEAVLRALRLTTGRERILSFIGSYHGGTAATVAISGHKSPVTPDEAAKRVLVPYPDAYRPFQDDPSGASVLAEIERRFATDAPPGSIAAAYVEAVQGDGGMLVPPPGFLAALAALAALCARHGIVLVCDEVKVGMGRSGLLHGFQHDGIQPDVVTYAKGLGGGLPVSAAVGPADLLDAAPAFAMQSLQGNPVCCAAGLAVLDTLLAERLPEHAAAIGDYFMQRLRALMPKHALIGDVRGRGLAIGVELVRDRASREPASRETAKLAYRCFELGLIVGYLGMHSNVLEITPPLVMGKEEVDEAIEILSMALNDVAAGKVDDARLQGFDGW